MTVNVDGRIRNNGVLQEITSFWNCIYEGSKQRGDARAYVYDGFSSEKANKLHIAFQGVKYDMQVWSDDELSCGEDWSKGIQSSIENTTHNGLVLVLLSEHSANSRFVKTEIEWTKRQHGKFIPIYIGHPVVPKEIADMIGDFAGYPIS